VTAAARRAASVELPFEALPDPIAVSSALERSNAGHACADRLLHAMTPLLAPVGPAPR